MSKKQKLFNLRQNISIQAQQIEYLMKSVAYKSESTEETSVFAEIALEKSENISKMSEKIGKILKH